jgi:membrane protease subunit HflK
MLVVMYQQRQQPEIKFPELPDLPWAKIARFLPLLILGAILLYLVTGCFYTVQNDSQAVVTRFGKYSRTTDPGLHFRWPWPIENVQAVQTQKVQSTEFGFRTVQAGRDTRYAEPTREDRDVSLMLTGDLNLAVVEWIVQYRVRDPKAYLFNLKKNEKEDAIRDVAETAMRRIVGDSSIDEVITTGRDRIASDARRVVQDMLDSFDAGIEIRVVKLQAAEPPTEVEEAFNEVNRAKQEQRKIINEALKERNQKIPLARGERDEMILGAEGYKSRVIQEASGEIAAFLARLTEYEKAPEITRERLYIEALQEILGNVRKTTIVDEDLEGILPLLQLENQAGKGGTQ